MEHGYSGRRGSMTVGAPGMEGEQSTQHTESHKDHREENALHFCRNVQFHQFQQVHGGSSGTIVDTENTHQQECGTAHQHQCQFHGGIFFLSATPHADEQIHRNQGHFIEHEHGKEVGRDEESEHSDTQKGEPKEIFLGHRLDLPGSKGSRKHDDGTQKKHHHRNTVHAYRIADVQGSIPTDTVGKEHLLGVSALTHGHIGIGQPGGQKEQGGRTADYHSANLVHTAADPEAEQHEQGYQYKKT